MTPHDGWSVPSNHATGRSFQTGAPGTSEATWGPLIDEASLRPWRLEATGTAVVVSPHPDDETLGAGGIIHDLSVGGWRVTVLAITDGEAALGRADARLMRRLARIRRLEQTRALTRLAP